MNLLPARTAPLATVLAMVIVAVACTQALPLATPTPSPSLNPSPSPSGSLAVSASPTLAPTATPSAPPTASPTPVPTPCPVVTQDGRLPSDRLVDVEASSGAGADRFIFHFGNASLPGPGGIPRGELTLAEAPYTFGPSGLPIEMTGERVIQVVFRQMSLSADTGEPVYQGPAALRPDLAALRHAVEYDESEGVIGWYIGFDGPACVTLIRSGNDVLVAFEHR